LLERVVTGLLPDDEPLEDEPDELLVRVVTGLDAVPEPDDVGCDPLVVCLLLVRVVTGCEPAAGLEPTLELGLAPAATVPWELVRVVTEPGLDAAALGPAATKW
jgi:hypothetical protein